MKVMQGAKANWESFSAYITMILKYKEKRIGSVNDLQTS